MYRIIAKTKGLSNEEWLKLRKNGIGGSDAGAVCGLNPYVSSIDVYMDKTSSDIIEQDENEAMRSGKDLEDYVARRFAEATGLKIRKANVMYASIEHPFMIADVDRLIVGKDSDGQVIGLECKTASPYSADKWKDGQIPAHYLAQCYHYMAVLNAKAWYIAVLIYGKEFKYLKIERDDDIVNSLIQVETDFWYNNVLAKVLPDPDGTEATDKAINRLFRSSKELMSKTLIGFDEKLKRRYEIDSLMDKLNTEKNTIDQEIKTYMQDAEIAENDKYIVTWKNIISNRINSTKLKAEEPDIYKKYINPISQRRFMVKAV